MTYPRYIDIKASNAYVISFVRNGVTYIEDRTGAFFEVKSLRYPRIFTRKSDASNHVNHLFYPRYDYRDMTPVNSILTVSDLDGADSYKHLPVYSKDEFIIRACSMNFALI